HARDVQSQRPEEEGDALMSTLLPEATTRLIIDASYLLVAFLFIFGLKRMSSPVTARGGILWAGAGMLIATLVTFLAPGIDPTNYWLILAAIAVGGVLAWVS